MKNIPDSFLTVDGVKYRVSYDEQTSQFESEPIVPEPVKATQRVFSYGGGIQSFACLILAAQGLLNFKTFFFCNVGADSENPQTIAHVEQVAKPFAKKHGLELIELRKTLRNGETDTVYKRLTRPGSRSIGIPVRMNGNGAPGRRSCTYDFKVAVVDKELRARGAKQTGAVVGIGISLDEVERVKPNTDPDTMHWKENHFPLIFDFPKPYTRQDCINLILQAGQPLPPKSACVFCPFHTLKRWQEMRTYEPSQFWYCVILERFINERRKALGLDPVWFCSKLKPLDIATTEYVQGSLFEPQDACDSGYCFL
jgi:hypothetical protein